MKQMILTLSVLVLFSCNGSSGGSSGNNSPGDLEAACNAKNVDEFFAAMSGSFEVTAIDTFTERDPAEETKDDTFVHEEVYTVSFSEDNSLSIPGEKGELSLTFGDDKDDLFDPYDNVVYVRFIRNDLDLTTRVSCEEEGKGEYSFFIAFSDPVDDPADQAFFWRLDDDSAL